MGSKQLLCRFFAQGTCNFGDECVYSHDIATAVPIPEDACLFFLRATCMYGDGCRKKHRTIEEIVNSYTIQSKDSAKTNSEEVQEQQQQQVQSTSNVASSRVATTSKSYATAASVSQITDENRASLPLCLYFESNGFCVYPNCSSIHGEYCDLCQFYSIHPFNESQAEAHRKECVKKHEESMEISFAYQRSKELTCGICLDVVLDKEPRKNRRFGILTDCTHIYCIECIRTWRNSEDVDKKNKRGCPQCRIKSDFIIPSEFFYDDKNEKQKLIDNYKKALGTKHCKYFKKGDGVCPFEGACFYKHELPDGRKATLPAPSRTRSRRATTQRDFFTPMLMDIQEILAELGHDEWDIMYDDPFESDTYDGSESENFSDLLGLNDPDDYC